MRSVKSRLRGSPFDVRGRSSRRRSHSGVRSEEEMVLIGWTEVFVDVPVSPPFSLSLFAHTFLNLIAQVVF